MLGLFLMMFLGRNCDILCLYFYKSPFTAVILPNFYPDLTSTFLDYSWQNLVGLFMQNHVCHQFPAQGSPEDRGREEQQAKIMDRTVIAERNVVRSDIMVPPLDSIYETNQTYNWGYL
jgi:hypothetical protein